MPITYRPFRGGADEPPPDGWILAHNLVSPKAARGFRAFWVPRDPKKWVVCASVAGSRKWANIIVQGGHEMRAAIYLRISTAEQTTDNQERELRVAAARMGYDVVEIYRDHAVSGSKGLHRDATRRRFDLVMAWSADRLGRSLQDLVSLRAVARNHNVGVETVRRCLAEIEQRRL